MDKNELVDGEISYVYDLETGKTKEVKYDEPNESWKDTGQIAENIENLIIENNNIIGIKFSLDNMLKKMYALALEHLKTTMEVESYSRVQIY